MLNDRSRMRSGDMEAELSAGVDGLLDEFMAVVDGMVKERHLQKGIARSQLPSSMVAILDQESLYILGQFRLENRTGSYYHRPDKSLTHQQVAKSGQWEFRFDDPFVIRFPVIVLQQSSEERKAALQAAAAQHIDSEFLRLVEKLSTIRNRPIFGQAGETALDRDLLLLQPMVAEKSGVCEAIQSTLTSRNLAYEEAPDIRRGRAAVRELWLSINYAAVILADLTGADPQVMYGLGIAHTLGKETVLIYPKGSSYLNDLPSAERVEYEDSDAGKTRLADDLAELLGRIVCPVLED